MGSSAATEPAYKLELHIWLESRDEFGRSKDRLFRGLKKYPGDCGIILFARESKEYLELPECRFNYEEPGLVEAIAHTFGSLNVDVVTRVSRRPVT